MANHNVVIRAFLKRGALFSMFLLMLLVAIGVAFQGSGNPTIQPGGTASFPRTGYDYPTYAMTWDIKNGSGTIVAQDDTPNGWNMTVVNDNLVVTAPSNAVVGTNYEVRFSGMMQEMGAVKSPAARSAAMKARIQVPRTFGGAPAKPCEKVAPVPSPRAKADPDDIIIIPVSKSAYFDVVSANVAPSAPSNLTATAVASNRINLSWHDNSNNESGFKIYRLAPGGSWTPVTTTASNITSYSDIPLLPSTTYSYKVTAVNSYGESSASNTATQTTFSSTVLPEGYAGNDFYVIVPDNCSTAHTNHSGAKVRIASQDGATGLLTLTSTGESTSFTVPAGGSTLVSLSDFHRLTQNDEVNNESYRVTTDNAVTVEVLDYDEFVSESWAVLPNAILGTEYVSSNYIGSGGYMSQIALVATTDNTVVTIKPPVICGSNRTPNVPFTVTLNRGQAYQLKSTQWDLTGTQITSTQPIGVVSGAQGARVPLEYGYGNPLEEQLLPFSRWQPEYVGIPFAHHPHARFRVTSARNRTHVSVYFGDTDTTTNYTLDAGQMQEIETTSPILVTADKPIQGMQLSNGEALDYNFNDPASVGDPMMVTMPSTYSPNNMRSNWLTNAIIPVANDGFDYHYVTLISETHAMTTMYLNGNVINGWQGIGNTRFEYVRVALSPGNNVINGIYQGGAVGVNFPARFIAYTSQFTESDAAGSIVGGLTVANDYVNVHPNDPTALSATAVSASAIDLAWTGDSNAYGYRIQRKLEAGQWEQIADVTDGSITAYHDTGRHHKTKYYYRVMAYADEDSGYSNTANATTFNEKPLMPTALNASALSDSQVKITWTDASDNEDHFYIQRSLDGQSGWTDVQTTNPDVTTWTDSDLTKKTTYFYRIKSSNEMGDLGWTAPASATTKDTPPLAPDLTVVSGASYNSMNLTWVDHSDNEDGFYVQRLDAAGQWQTVATKLPNQTAHLDNIGLQPLTEYTYRIVAFNNGGQTPSNSRSGSTLEPPVPNAPTNLVATATYNDEIQLSWSESSPYVDGFNIQRSTDEVNWTPLQTVVGSLQSYSDETVSSGTTYYYRVRAYNSSGHSNWSNEASDTTPVYVAGNGLLDVQPSSFYSVVGNSLQVRILTANRVSVPTAVQLWSTDTSISAPTTVTIPTGERSALATVNCVGTTESYVQINAKLGSSVAGTNIVTLGTGDLSSIGGLGVAEVGGATAVTWSGLSPRAFGNPVFHNQATTPLLGYVVYRRTSFGMESQISQATHSSGFLDSSRMPGQVYSYQVRLVDVSGNVLASSSWASSEAIGAMSGVQWISQPTMNSSGQLQGSVRWLGKPSGYFASVFVNGVFAGRCQCNSIDVWQTDTSAFLIDNRMIQEIVGQGTSISVQVLADDGSSTATTLPISVSRTPANVSVESETGVYQQDMNEIYQGTFSCPGATSWTVTLTTSDLHEINFSGTGPRAKVFWDGKLPDGTSPQSGQVKRKVTFNQNQQHYGDNFHIMGVKKSPKFLMLLNATAKESMSNLSLYGKFVHDHTAGRLGGNDEVVFFVEQYNLDPLGAEVAEGNLTKDTIVRIKTWLATTVEDFMFYGHGKVEEFDFSNITFVHGSGLRATQALVGSGIDIGVVTRHKPNNFRVVALEMCNSAGPSGNTEAPGEVDHSWQDAFGISDESSQAFIGWNGQTEAYYGSGGIFRYGEEIVRTWGDWAHKFWVEAGAGKRMDEAVATANNTYTTIGSTRFRPNDANRCYAFGRARI